MLRRLIPVDPAGHGYPQLDGLRAVAFMLVLLVHSVVALQDAGASPTAMWIMDLAGPLVQMGGTGVHLFFVLSGFLLFLPFAQRLIDGRPLPRTGDFYWRRIRRIVPAYYGVLAVCYLFFADDDGLRQAVSHAFFVHNIWTDTFGGLNEPMWTLSVEWQFYVLLPALAMLLNSAWRRRPRAALIVLALTVPLSVGSAAASVLTERAAPEWFADHLTLFTTSRFIVVFAAGVACALLYALHRRDVAPGSLVRLLVSYGGWFAGAVFALYGIAGFAGAVPAWLDFYGYALAMAAMYGCLLMHLMLNDGWLAHLLSWPPLRMIGNISFSGYLVHKPLLVEIVAPFAAERATGGGQVLLLVAGIMLVVLPGALVVYVLLERPFTRARRATTGKKQEATAPGSAAGQHRRTLA